jgi:Notch-like protein
MKSIHILFFGLTIKPIVGVNDFFPQIGEITSTDTKQKINDAEPCGESFCYHGSKCLAGINIGNGTTEDICDCTSAFTDTQAYAGEFCQYPSTDFCGDPAFGSNRNFCVNNGVCESSGYAPCQCPNGFKGPRCAFEVGKDGVEYSECKLKCENGATCQKGLKKADLGKYARFADDISHLINETHTHVDFEHCVCPPGYFGISCEYEVEECGKGDHFCFHGSTCSEDETNCDCESSDFDTAGLFCENASTEECPEESFLPDDKHRGFCVNGGKCNLKEDG